MKYSILNCYVTKYISSWLREPCVIFWSCLRPLALSLVRSLTVYTGTAFSSLLVGVCLLCCFFSWCEVGFGDMMIGDNIDIVRNCAPICCIWYIRDIFMIQISLSAQFAIKSIKENKYFKKVSGCIIYLFKFCVWWVYTLHHLTAC